MKIAKESFIGLLRSLKTGGSDIVSALAKISKEEKDLLGKILEKLDSTENSIKGTKTEEVTVKNPLDIKKPSWWPKDETKDLLKKILEKLDERQDLPTKDGRVLVAVDKVGGSSAGGFSPADSTVLRLMGSDIKKGFENGLVIPSFDFSSQAQAATTDTWTFKSGGSGGTTVATVTITYTDATKEIIDNIELT